MTDLGPRIHAFGLIEPDWPAPRHVRAAATTRCVRAAGAAQAFNLGHGPGTDPAEVARNRAALRELLDLPAEPLWLAQVHGTRVVDAGRFEAGGRPRPPADACVARAPGRVCAVLSADCVPVLLCDRAGTRVAAAHAGWRGLAAGVLEATVAALEVDPGTLVAWLGPAIGGRVYEVGAEVREALLAGDPGAQAAFTPSPAGRWYADLPALARRRLARAGLASVHGGDLCTYSDPKRFFSFRRDGASGRMATLIWLDSAGR